MKTRILILAALFAFLGSSAVSASIAQAKAFATFQKQTERAQLADFNEADRSLNEVLAHYANAVGSVYWTDKYVVRRLGIFGDRLVSYEERADSFWKRARKAARASRSAAQRSLRGTRKVRKCVAARRNIADARRSFHKGASNFKSAQAAYRRAEPLRLELNGSFIAIVSEVLPESSHKITDGHIDDAVYVFGTDQLIDMPHAERKELDPELIVPAAHLLYAYDDALIDVVEMTAVEDFTRARKLARSGLRKARSCRGG